MNLKLPKIDPERLLGFLRSVRADLVEKRLWIGLLIAPAAFVAAFVLLNRSGTPPAPAAVQLPPVVQPAGPASVRAADTADYQALAETTGGGRFADQGGAHDPFVPLDSPTATNGGCTTTSGTATAGDTADAVSSTTTTTTTTTQTSPSAAGDAASDCSSATTSATSTATATSTTATSTQTTTTHAAGASSGTGAPTAGASAPATPVTTSTTTSTSAPAVLPPSNTTSTTTTSTSTSSSDAATTAPALPTAAGYRVVIRLGVVARTKPPTPSSTSTTTTTTTTSTSTTDPTTTTSTATTTATSAASTTAQASPTTTELAPATTQVSPATSTIASAPSGATGASGATNGVTSSTTSSTASSSASASGSDPSKPDLRNYGLTKAVTLPSGQDPKLSYVGVRPDGRTVTFRLRAAAILKGPASCLPSATDCAEISLTAGQVERLDFVTAGAGSVTYELTLKSVTALAHL